MKKFVSVLLVVMLMFAFNSYSQKVTIFNGDEHIVKNLKTTDSAYHYIDSITLKANEGGIAEVSVIGFAYDTAYSVTGKQIVRFNKRRGTLTLGTPTVVLAIETDTVLGSATFALVSSGDKIYVRIKGKNTYNMRWQSVTKWKSVWP
jgi:hypothetical protein